MNRRTFSSLCAISTAGIVCAEDSESSANLVEKKCVLEFDGALVPFGPLVSKFFVSTVELNQRPNSTPEDIWLSIELEIGNEKFCWADGVLGRVVDRQLFYDPSERVKELFNFLNYLNFVRIKKKLFLSDNTYDLKRVFISKLDGFLQALNSVWDTVDHEHGK